MKVFLAIASIDYEGGYILGVFSSKKLAEDRIKEDERERGYPRGDSQYVEEVELDRNTEVRI